MSTFHMSHSEVLDMSFLEVQRLVEEYNDMNKCDDSETGNTVPKTPKEPDWNKLKGMPGISINVK